MNSNIKNSMTIDIKQVILQSFVGGITAFALSLIGVCILALVLFINPLFETDVAIFSLIIKYFCAIVAGVISCINKKQKGFLRGILGAVFFYILGFLVYGIFGAHISFDMMSLIDLIVFIVIGLLSGAVVVNLNAKKR